MPAPALEPAAAEGSAGSPAAARSAGDRVARSMSGPLPPVTAEYGFSTQSRAKGPRGCSAGRRSKPPKSSSAALPGPLAKELSEPVPALAARSSGPCDAKAARKRDTARERPFGAGDEAAANTRAGTTVESSSFPGVVANGGVAAALAATLEVAPAAEPAAVGSMALMHRAHVLPPSAHPQEAQVGSAAEN